MPGRKKHRYQANEPGQDLDPDSGSPDVTPKPYPLTFGRGKHTTLNDEIIERVSMTVGHGLTIPVACAALAIPSGTWKSWSTTGRAHRELGVESVFTRWLDALDQAKGAVEASWVSQLVAFGASDAKPLMWLLERRFPNRYAVDKRDKKALGEGKDTAHKTTAELLAELASMGAKLPPGLGVGALGSGPTTTEESSPSLYDEDDSEDSPGVLNLASTVTDVED